MIIKHWTPLPNVLAYLDSSITPEMRVLEIGPGNVPFSKATMFVTGALDHIAAANIVCVDINTDKLPFEDKSFDFIYCRHVVEDLYNPFNVLREMSRVGKAGYIETPSPVCELTRGVDGGDPKHRGYIHHRWLVWAEDTTLCLVEKAPIVEHVAFDATVELEATPMLWNTYFQWNNSLNVKHFQHGIDFDLHFNYGPLLNRAISNSRRNIIEMTGLAGTP